MSELLFEDDDDRPAYPAKHGIAHHDETPNGLSTCRCGFTAPHAVMLEHFRANPEPYADDLPAVLLIRVPDERGITALVGWTYDCGEPECCRPWDDSAPDEAGIDQGMDQSIGPVKQASNA